MANKNDSLDVPRLFTLLQQATEDEEDEHVLDLTKKILDVSRDDPDALHCQLVSFINLSRFDSALELIHTINKKGKGQSRVYQLEEAYCLYRQEKYQAALSILSSLPQNEAKVLELVAQVAYRQEHYSKAVQTYQQLLTDSKNLQERMANYYAALSLCPALMDKGMMTEPHSTETMEQCFNLACCHLVDGRGQEAMQLLNKAELLYRESLEEEELSEEEMMEEMALIQVQRGYCYQASVTNYFVPKSIH